MCKEKINLEEQKLNEEFSIAYDNAFGKIEGDTEMSPDEFFAEFDKIIAFGE